MGSVVTLDVARGDNEGDHFSRAEGVQFSMALKSYPVPCDYETDYEGEWAVEEWEGNTTWL